MSGGANSSGRPVDHDVLVVGTGPAGAVAAMLLAAAGVAVAIQPERRTAGLARPSVGETLPPPARPTFTRLGLDALLDDSSHLASPGTVSSWGDDIRIADFLFSPYGLAVHLDREHFDAALLERALAAGARLAPVDRSHGSGNPRAIVDATGRAAARARAFGWRLERSDRLVALVGTLERGRSRVAADARCDEPVGADVLRL